MTEPCLKHKKMYSGTALMTIPVAYPWICELCGERGNDYEAEMDPNAAYNHNLYNEVCKKFPEREEPNHVEAPQYPGVRSSFVFEDRREKLANAVSFLESICREPIFSDLTVVSVADDVVAYARRILRNGDMLAVDDLSRGISNE